MDYPTFIFCNVRIVNILLKIPLAFLKICNHCVFHSLLGDLWDSAEQSQRSCHHAIPASPCKGVDDLRTFEAQG